MTGWTRAAVGAVVGAAVAWVAAPWVAMARHGTLDQQALAAMREPVIPRPRIAPDDLLRRTPVELPEGDVPA